MDALDNKALDEHSLISNSEINDYLLQTAKWGKFLAILGYIGLGIFALAGLASLGDMSNSGLMIGNNTPTGLILFFYLAFAILNYFPVTYLYRYSVKIKQGVQLEDIAITTEAFQNLKSLFKFMGIFTIVILSIYVLALLVAIPIMLS